MTRITLLAGLSLSVLTASAPGAESKIDFGRDVLPILAERCFACHGPDTREGKGGLRLDLPEAAREALAPGRPEASEVARRIMATSPQEVMPPPRLGKPLSDAQKEVLRQWIAAGAPYRTHWAFTPPVKVTPPPVRDTGWVRNEIDRFILARLEKAGMKPSPEADRPTLVRRVSLDMRGLPPTVAEVEAFVNDSRPDAYERMVERMLASPHHGEKMALLWMDLARYGDTNGYHYDSTRQVWLWRDWVIQAYNSNMPFDRFTIEQLAGDLLPDATLEQKIASGFNRNTRYNEEGGADPAEFLVRYAVDRTNTLGQVWLGLTLGCAECHSHKYDPITHKEYYQLFAFFNSFNEPGAQGHRQKYPPLVQAPSPEQQQVVADARAALTALEARQATALAEARQKGETPKVEAALQAWSGKAVKDSMVPEPIRKLLGVPASKRTRQQAQQLLDHFLGSVHPATRGPLQKLAKEVEAARTRLSQLEGQVPFQLVSVEMSQPRPAHVLMRGDFQKPGEKVERDVPALFPPFPADRPRDRLGLAYWLVDPRHPLTARVTVNRYWAQLFGRGIVETIGDFGTQGRFPSHPELLDWLAVEFVESGWDTRAILRTILHSATYRQTSVNDHRYDDRDPENRLLWRGARFRLLAEEVRDTALRISGLLSPKVGGEPVFPYQPPDYYRGKLGGWKWELSQGEDRYRRGMYTFWRRTTPYPTFIIFDAPDRSECVVARERTNTPLQALVTMNDPQFVEAARVLGQRLLSMPGADLDARLTHGFRLAVARPPAPAELDLLRQLWLGQEKHYRANPAAAAALVKVGAHPRPEGLDPVEHAAWTALASVLLNLDETITRE